MAMTEIIKRFEKEILQQLEEKQRLIEGITAFTSFGFAELEEKERLIEEIAAFTSLEFAELAAGVLEPGKHSYGFKAYLRLLDNLKILLYAGMPDDLALESVQSGYDVDTILAIWRLSKV